MLTLIRRKNENKRAREKRIKLTLLVVAAGCIVVFILAFPKIKKDIKYKNAVSYVNNGQYENAISVFEGLNGYKDSDEQIENCKNEMNESVYESAISYMVNGQYGNAISMFEELNGYKDSDEQIENCKNTIYESAVTLMYNGEYENAIDAFEEVSDYKDSSEQIENCRNAISEAAYESAVTLMNNGQYTEAYNAFVSMNGYKDSNDKVKEVMNLYPALKYKDANIGDEIEFGNYNGNTKWIVLDKTGGKLLLLSEYVIEKRPFNTERVDTSWEECSLRNWLNNTYFNEAFSNEEKAIIIESNIENKAYGGGFAEVSGPNTIDKVFLLLEEEVERYMIKSSINKDKAIATLPDGTIVNWWLRSTFCYNSYKDDLANFVTEDGDVGYSDMVNELGIGVRPAMWIDTN